MIPGVAPLILAAAGGLALGIAVAILRGFGPRYRVGRLLAVVPKVSVAEALQLAGRGRASLRPDRGPDRQRRRVRGPGPPPPRLSPDLDALAPVAGPGAWTPLEEPTVESVPFTVGEGLDDIAVDGPSLGAGLVVVAAGERRAWSATWASERPTTSRGNAELRLRIEYLSSIDHATVLGVSGSRRGRRGRRSAPASDGR